MWHIFCIFALIITTFSQDWNYENQRLWPSISGSCGSTRQSPINIQLKDVKIRSLRLKANNYHLRFRRSIAENTGYTVQVSLNSRNNKTPYLTGSAVRNEKFILDSFHFHWGESNNAGSEHRINGIQYAGEVHFVHYNSIYDSGSVAAANEDGLTVLTVFLKLSSFDNYALNPILNSIPKILTPDTNTIIKDSIYLNALLPLDGNVFFRYNGSLTTPPCSETVTWIIFANGIYISGRQLYKFRKIFGDGENGVNIQLTQNFRELQPINNRTVEATGYPILPIE